MLIFLVYKPDKTKKKAEMQKKLIGNQSLATISMIVTIIDIIVKIMAL